MKDAALNFAAFLLVLGLVVGATLAFYNFAGPNCPDGTFKFFTVFYEWHCVPEIGRSP